METGDVLIDKATPGTQQTVAWKVSQYDRFFASQQISTNSVTFAIHAQGGTFALPISTSIPAIQAVSAVMSEPGASLYTTVADAQSAAQSGTRSYLIQFGSLPTGLTANASNGQIQIGGTLMAVGNQTITYTPKRVLADGTVLALPTQSVSFLATAPASGVTIPTPPARAYEALTITPTVSTGLCQSLQDSGTTVPDEGACVLTWTNVGPLTQNGVALSGTPTQAGTISPTWMVEFVKGADHLQLDGGSVSVDVIQATHPTMTLIAPSTGKALDAVSYELHMTGCGTDSLAGDQATAISMAQQSGVPTCFIEPSLPTDFGYIASVTQDLNAGAMKYVATGIYSSGGQKSASFVFKKAMSDGTVLESIPATILTTINASGYSFQLNTPSRARPGKVVTATLQSLGQTCIITEDASVTNAIDTPADQRKCVVSYTDPAQWTGSPDGLTAIGTQPTTGDTTIQWQVNYPLTNKGSLDNVVLASGSKTIIGDPMVAPAFRIMGMVATDNVIKTNSKGDLGILIVDNGAASQALSAKVKDANGLVIGDISSLVLNQSKGVKIASLGAIPMLSSASISIAVGYSGDNSDLFTEKTYQVVRMPDQSPRLKFTSQKRVRVGDNADILVQLGEIARGGFVNDPNHIGLWKVRVAKLNADKTLTYLSEYQAVTAADGKATVVIKADKDVLDVPLVGVATMDTDVVSAAKTLNTTPFVVQEYIWPVFDAEVKQPVAFAPSTVRLTAVPADSRFYRQSVEPANKVTYAWSVPDGVTILKADGPVANLALNLAGQYEIVLTISDANGSISSITKTIQVAEPAPFSVDLKMYSANKWPSRAPAAFSIRPSITGGHPSDRIANYTLTVDGAEIYSGEKAPRTLGLEAAGTHTIDLKITSKMGGVGEFTKTLELAANQNPQCQLKQKVSSGTANITANCTDSDGRVKSYVWTIDGEVKTANRNYMTFKVAPTGSTVDVTATDDVGGTSTLHTTLSP